MQKQTSNIVVFVAHWLEAFECSALDRVISDVGNYFLSFNGLPSSSALTLLNTFQEICLLTFSFKSSSVTCHLIRQVMQVPTIKILYSSQAVLMRPI